MQHPPEAIWRQLKPINQEFVLKRIETDSWDLAVDIARLSFASIQNTSTSDLLIQEALRKFNSAMIQIKEQILEGFRSSTSEYAQSILADVNRQLAIVHQRLEAVVSENASMRPALKESLASLNGSASALTALVASLKIPTTKGEMGEVSVLDSLRSAFLGIPSVSIEALGGAGETDILIRLECNGVELAKERRRREVLPFVGDIKTTMTSRPPTLTDLRPLPYLPDITLEVAPANAPKNWKPSTINREELYLLSKISLSESGLSPDDLSKRAMTREEIAKMVRKLEEQGLIEPVRSVKGRKKAVKYTVSKAGAQLALDSLKYAPEESWLWLTEGEFSNTPLGRIYKRKSGQKEMLHPPQKSANH